MPFPRSDAAATVAHGRILVVGGYAGSGLESIGQPLLASVDMFDTLTGQWAVLPNLPEPRAVKIWDLEQNPEIYCHSLLFFGGSLFVVGGWDGVTVKNSVYAARAVNPRRWEEVRTMRNIRKCFTSIVANDRIYVAGGHNGTTIISDAEIFDGTIWISVATLRCPRSATAIIALSPVQSFEFIRIAKEFAEKQEELDDNKTANLPEIACYTPKEANNV